MPTKLCRTVILAGGWFLPSHKCPCGHPATSKTHQAMVQCAAMAMLLALLAAPLLLLHTAVAQGDPYCDRAKNSSEHVLEYATSVC